MVKKSRNYSKNFSEKSPPFSAYPPPALFPVPTDNQCSSLHLLPKSLHAYVNKNEYISSPVCITCSILNTPHHATCIWNSSTSGFLSQVYHDLPVTVCRSPHSFNSCVVFHCMDTL